MQNKTETSSEETEDKLPTWQCGSVVLLQSGSDLFHLYEQNKKEEGKTSSRSKWFKKIIKWSYCFRSP